MFTIPQSLKSYSFRYDFSVDGGLQGTFFSPFTLPEGVNILQASIHCILTPTSNANLSTFDFGLSSVGNMFLSGESLLSFSSGNVYYFTLNGFVKNWVSVPNNGNKLAFTINTEDLTAGILNFNVLYLEF